MNIDIQVSPAAGVPLYRQVANEIKAACLRGYVRPGERLPSVRELATTLGLNPTTVVKAYDLLAHERVITRRQGQGAFVADGEQPLLPGERQALLARLAHELALEGRRLGMSETALIALLRDELRQLRPVDSRSKR